MSRTALEMASLRHMLNVLRQDATAVVTIKELRHYLTRDEKSRLERDHRELKKAKEYSDCRALPLSGEAEAYWRKAKRAMQATQLAHNTGDSGRLKAAGKLCEAADEFYYEAVAGTPSAANFREYSTDPAMWDDRWHNTHDFHIPLLVEHYANYPDPLRSAVINMLEEILEPVTQPTIAQILSLQKTQSHMMKLVRKGS